MTTDKATFGGGCFWCTEAIFSQINGVISIKSGYSGGSIEKPCYIEVCNGTTGHAEAIQLVYDKNIITYEQIIKIHLTTHNPTMINKQGADRGSQYRSVIFTHDFEQEKIAHKIINELTPCFDNPIVTEVVSYNNFHEAEEHHQNYYNSDPNKRYCSAVITPKLIKLRERYKHLVKSII